MIKLKTMKDSNRKAMWAKKRSHNTQQPTKQTTYIKIGFNGLPYAEAGIQREKIFSDDDALLLKNEKIRQFLKIV